MKTVAVIGAGAGGLAAIKCCLDEGFEPTCFEMSDYVGGLWHYTDTVGERHACVIKSTVANVSKEMMCYSDFPPGKTCPIFMHHTDALNYLEQYAKHFKLRERIEFNTEVVWVERTEDFADTGQWNVTTRNLSTKHTETRTFDGVMVCTGVYANPHVPEFPGQHSFKGKIMHSHRYRTSEGFEGKRVLIIGIGNTAGDIAVDLSMVASKVYISSKQGAWIVSRVGPEGRPFDMYGFTRAKNVMLQKLPSFANRYLYKILNSRFDHNKFSLRPTHSPLKTNGFLNDDLPSRIISGRVELHADIKTFTKTGVEFSDGLSVDHIDVVILATGYRVDYPFLEDNVISEDKRDLYKAIFPPDLAKNTLAVIGSFRQRGPIVPVLEMQCRCAVAIFKGHVQLPPSLGMHADIRRRKKRQLQLYNESLHYSLQVDYIPYMDELSQVIGCKPNIGKLFLSDPTFAMKVFFDACTPYQYRLTGPGAWDGAKKAIQTQWDRIYYPVNTRRIDNQYLLRSNGNLFAYVFVVLVALMCYFWFK